MAIIDSKLAIEAQREAREYAQRNDTAASQDWQQPPPAYEESSAPTTSGSSQQAQSSRSVEAQDDPESQESRPQLVSQRSGNSADSNISDESTPLLTRRQKQLIKKKLRARHKIRRGLKFIASTLILACIALLLLELAGLLDNDEELPDAPASDGDPIERPIWSPDVKTDPDLWIKPDVPLYSSHANFTFDAFKAHFLHARDNGASYSGQVSAINAAEINDDDWKRMTGGLSDRIFVDVEARYTEVALRNAVRINKMRMNEHKEGLGIYGSSTRRSSKDYFLSFHVIIYLPAERQRTSAGLLQDGSSFIPELDIGVDNLRLTVDFMNNPIIGQGGRVTFGTLKTDQLNGALTLVGAIKATEEVSLHLLNGHVNDVMVVFPTYTITAPYININVVNGGIWLRQLIASQDISLKTVNGGINITDIAIAKSIKVKHSTGITGGTYRAQNLEVQAVDSEILMNIDLGMDLSGLEFTESQNQDVAISGNIASHCEYRNVKIEVDAGSSEVKFKNHDPRVQLHSKITANAGSITVTHDSSFEGKFQGHTTLGKIELHGPHGEVLQAVEKEQSIALPESGMHRQGESEKLKSGTKVFLVTTDKRGPFANKEVQGKTWWADHRWNERNQFCVSSSFIDTKIGNLDMFF